MRNQDFAKGREGLEKKLECSYLKKVAIGQHVEHTGAIQANRESVYLFVSKGKMFFQQKLCYSE